MRLPYKVPVKTPNGEWSSVSAEQAGDAVKISYGPPGRVLHAYAIDATGARMLAVAILGIVDAIDPTLTVDIDPASGAHALAWRDSFNAWIKGGGLRSLECEEDVVSMTQRQLAAALDKGGPIGDVAKVAAALAGRLATVETTLANVKR